MRYGARDGYEDDGNLSARTAIYKLALRMPTLRPEAVDLAGESDETRNPYDLDDPDTEDTGCKCLLARRRGGRVVQVYSGSSQCGAAWDAHSGIKDGHRKCAKWIDRPVAGLLQGLKRAGLLNQTLIVGLSEFGRMPISHGGTGRDHNPGAQHHRALRRGYHTRNSGERDRIAVSHSLSARGNPASHGP